MIQIINIAIEKKINADRLYLQQNPASKITRLENETKIAKDEIVTYKENNKYIKQKIEEISSLVYDNG